VETPLHLHGLVLGIGLHVAERILHIAPEHLSFALDLLNSALDFFASVPSEIANLALGASYCLINGALHSVLIHISPRKLQLLTNPASPLYRKGHFTLSE
jgi:hypothetical protein